MILSVIMTISYLRGDLIGIQFKTASPESHVLQEFLKLLSPHSPFAAYGDAMQLSMWSS